VLALLLNKYFLIGAGALMLVAGSYTKGRMDSSEVWQEKIATEQALSMVRQLQERDKIAVIDQRLTEKLEGLKANETTIERVRVKLVDRPVYRNICADSRGLQLVESARTGTAPPIAGAGDDALP